MSMLSDPSAHTGAGTSTFEGAYADGRAPVSLPVRAAFGTDGIEITAEPWPQPRRWAYADLTANTPVKGRATDALLRSTQHDGETLFLEGAGLGAAVLARAPHLSALRQRFVWMRPGLAVVAVVAVIAGLIQAFDISPSQALARRLPQTAREHMGVATVQSIAGQHRVCETTQSRAALDRLTLRLVAVAQKDPLRVRVRVVDWGLVNAFAVPGGQIILTRGLLATAQSPDEVAGVLAHELGHTVELHPETGLVRAAGLATAGQLIFAGSSGAVTNLGLVVTQIQYTRVAEHEADAHAVRILKAAGISAKGLADFFKRIDSPRERSVLNNAVIRTHPLTAERIAFVTSQPAYPATPALTAEDWAALRSACGAAPPAPTAPAADAQATIADATEALKKEPQDVAQLRRRAIAYGRTGKQDLALADWDKAIAVRPQDTELHILRGGTLDALRRYEDALKAYDEALRINPMHAGARNRHGLSNRGLQRYEAALQDFDQLVTASPKYVAGQYNRGLVLMDLKRPEEAMEAFDRAIALDKAYAAAYAHRGLIHEAGGRRDAAVAEFRAALGAKNNFESTAWAHKTAREHLATLGASPTP